MGPFVALAVLAVVFVPVIVIIARTQAAEREKRIAVWRGFANEHGLRLLEPSGPWYRRRGWALEGTIEGAALRLDTYTVNSGKHQVTYTRTTAAIERSLPKILATPRSIFTSWGEALGWRTIATGDEAFDRKVAVRSKE